MERIVQSRTRAKVEAGGDGREARRGPSADPRRGPRAGSDRRCRGKPGRPARGRGREGMVGRSRPATSVASHRDRAELIGGAAGSTRHRPLDRQPVGRVKLVVEVGGQLRFVVEVHGIRRGLRPRGKLGPRASPLLSGLACFGFRVSQCPSADGLRRADSSSRMIPFESVAEFEPGPGGAGSGRCRPGWRGSRRSPRSGGRRTPSSPRRPGGRRPGRPGPAGSARHARPLARGRSGRSRSDRSGGSIESSSTPGRTGAGGWTRGRRRPLRARFTAIR